MMDGEDGPVRSRRREHLAQEVGGLFGEEPELLIGHRGVQRDDAQVVVPVDLVDRPGLRCLPEQVPAELRAPVVVARQVDHRGPGRLGGTVHDLGQVLVALGVTGVGQIAGEHEHVRMEPHLVQPPESGHQVVPRVPTVEPGPVGHQMHVGDLDDQVSGHPIPDRRSLNAGSPRVL